MTPLPPLRPGVLVADTGRGAAVFEPVAGLLHELSPQAALVLDGCEQGWAIDDLVDEVATAAGVPREVVAADVAACVRDLEDRGVVGGPPAEPERPEPSGTDEAAPGPAPAAPPVPSVEPPSAPRSVEPEPSTGRADEPPPPWVRAQVVRHDPTTHDRGPAGNASPRHLARPLRLVDRTAVLRSDEADLVRWVDATFADLTHADPAADEGRVTIDLRSRDGLVWIRSTDPAVRRFDDAGIARDDLMAVLNAVAASSTKVLALHAGVVRAPNGVTVALLGEAEAGKSTLTAGLVQAGWGYLSDEIAAIRPGSLHLVPYPKPLALDPGSRAILGLAAGGPGPVRPEVLRDDALVRGAERLILDRLVVVDLAPGATTTLTSVAPSETLRRIAPHALNLGRCGRPGLAALVAVAGRPCHRLVRGDVEGAVGVMDDLVGRGPGRSRS